MTSSFAFLEREWPAEFDAESRVEVSVDADPRTACFYSRRTLELAVAWAYEHDSTLSLPYQDNLSALMHAPTYKQAAGDAVYAKARLITTLGNRAVHIHRPIPLSRMHSLPCANSSKSRTGSDAPTLETTDRRRAWYSMPRDSREIPPQPSPRQTN